MNARPPYKIAHRFRPGLAIPLIPSAQSRLPNSPSPDRRPNGFSNSLPSGPCRRWSTKPVSAFQVNRYRRSWPNRLQPLLFEDPLNRAEGALVINAVGISIRAADEMAAAVAHLVVFPISRCDDGQYYARSW